MGTVETSKYVRKPLYVEAVQVTSDNFLDVASWCQALVGLEDGSSTPGNEVRPADGFVLDTEKNYIRIRVHSPKSQRQTKAFVGDWILYTDRGYKVYTDKAFQANFDPVDTAVDFVQQQAEPPSLAAE